MAFCTNCGQQLPNGSKFCSNCGQQVNSYGNIDSETNKTVCEGKLHVCSQCGTVLGSLDAACPSCGNEIRGRNGSKEIKDLLAKLESATNDTQLITIIKSFPIPNNKEDIFEFMVLASTNFDSSYYVAHLNDNDISDAWLAKVEQCYHKAKILFSDQADFVKIEEIYNKIKNECQEKEEIRKREMNEYLLDKKREESSRAFKNGKLKNILFVYAVLDALMMAVAFNDGKILAGIVAVAIFVLLAVSILMGYNVIKEKIVNIKILLIIIAFLLIIPYFNFYSA
jgi:RNA polymerase subunit RPABC4/transcription elongation factor Spt4